MHTEWVEFNVWDYNGNNTVDDSIIKHMFSSIIKLLSLCLIETLDSVPLYYNYAIRWGGGL